MIKSGHTGLTTQPCGFIIHPTQGWLGASPDAHVTDPSCYVVGIAKFKCPYIKRDKTPFDACADVDFCGECVDGKFRLKQGHLYQHQVQLQLYVGGDLYSFCDFGVYTPAGIATERIYPSWEWEMQCVPKLKKCFHGHMVLEIMNPMYKPSYHS